MLCGKLDGIQNAQHFIEIAPAAHGINQHQFDLFIRADQENGADRRIVRGSTAFTRRSRLCRQHVVEFRDLEFRVSNHRIGHFVTLGFFNIRRPLAVTGNRIDAEADNFRVALGKLRLKARHVAEFGRAYRGEILGVRKQDRPAISNPFMKVNLALRGFRGEVWSFGIDAKRHYLFSLK